MELHFISQMALAVISAAKPRGFLLIPNFDLRTKKFNSCLTPVKCRFSFAKINAEPNVIMVQRSLADPKRTRKKSVWPTTMKSLAIRKEKTMIPEYIQNRKKMKKLYKKKG